MPSGKYTSNIWVKGLSTRPEKKNTWDLSFTSAKTEEPLTMKSAVTDFEFLILIVIWMITKNKQKTYVALGFMRLTQTTAMNQTGTSKSSMEKCTGNHSNICIIKSKP